MLEILILFLLLPTGKKCLILTIIVDMTKSLTAGGFNTASWGIFDYPFQASLKESASL